MSDAPTSSGALRSERPLPRDETSFFGRQEELAEIERRFEGGARLVTIVGLGGMGKTRLALVAAGGAKVRALYASLANARSLEASVREIGRLAHVRFRADANARSALVSLAAAIAKRGPLLLVLDGTEHLGSAARELVDALLDGADDLRVLATGREAIHARAEEKIVLAPLTDADAIALLRDRARSGAGAHVEMSEAEAAAIVGRVDRIPLAIELAGARLGILSPATLLARLGEHLGVLSDVSGMQTPSHRTMHAMLDGSWELLSDVERSALLQVSVFAAPFDVEAAEEVAELDGVEVLDVLDRLVSRSLVVRCAEGGRVRVGMFETVRAWARAKLDALPKPVTDPALDDARMRHARHYLARAERSARETYGTRAVIALDTLSDLLPELVHAFETTKESAPAMAARIVLSLTDVFLFRGFFELRGELLAAGVEVAERSKDDRLLARALVAKARSTLEEGRMQDAEREIRRAIERASSSGDEVTRAEATRALGWALTALGRGDEAHVALAAAESMHREQGSSRGLADVHVARGILCSLRGRPAEALGHFREALSIHVEQGDVLRQEKVLGFGELVGHDPREIARALPREVLARTPRSSLDVLPGRVAEWVRQESAGAERWQDAIALYRRGINAYDRADYDSAIRHFERAIEALERTGMKPGLAAVHAHLSVAHAVLRDMAEAKARLTRAQTLLNDDPSAELTVRVFASAVDVFDGGDRATARALLARANRAEVATPELSVSARVLEHAIEACESAGESPTTSRQAPVLVVGRESRWIVPPGGSRADLSRYGPVRRLIERLVVARLETPDTAISAAALIEAGWPGERMRHSAALLRVYSAVRRLRRLGLETLLMTRDDGYLLDPEAPVRRDDTP